MHFQMGTLASYQHRSTTTLWAGRSETFSFGAYTVAPSAREVLISGQPVELGSRAFDLLVVLLQGRGRLICKEEIMRAVWPTTTVVEANLRMQVAILRRALGTEGTRIKTIPGRGYMFVSGDDLFPRKLDGLTLYQR